jgi:hypothetical protein
MCVTDDERNELYWRMLKEAILDRYKEYNNYIPFLKQEKVSNEDLIANLDN